MGLTIQTGLNIIQELALKQKHLGYSMNLFFEEGWSHSTVSFCFN